MTFHTTKNKMALENRLAHLHIEYYYSGGKDLSGKTQYSKKEKILKIVTGNK